jgi:hypothetical protein
MRVRSWMLLAWMSALLERLKDKFILLASKDHYERAP